MTITTKLEINFTERCLDRVRHLDNVHLEFDESAPVPMVGDQIQIRNSDVELVVITRKFVLGSGPMEVHLLVDSRC